MGNYLYFIYQILVQQYLIKLNEVIKYINNLFRLFIIIDYGFINHPIHLLHFLHIFKNLLIHQNFMFIIFLM